MTSPFELSPDDVVGALDKKTGYFVKYKKHKLKVHKCPYSKSVIHDVLRYKRSPDSVYYYCPTLSDVDTLSKSLQRDYDKCPECFNKNKIN